MIKAVIFDMDGVLIDSEPIWQDAEIAVFQSVNITLTREMCAQTKGLKIDEVVDYWYDQFPWTEKSKDAIRDEIIQEVIRLIKENGNAMPGVIKVLEMFQQQGIPIAVASSSFMEIILAVVNKLGIKNYFSLLWSAEYEKYGKPHPDIYIHTAEKLQIKPYECLAIEDSVNGMIAALAARMKTLVVPDPTEYDLNAFGASHFKSRNFTVIQEDDIKLFLS